MAEASGKPSIRRASIPVLRARYSLPGTSVAEKRRIAAELLRRKERAGKARRSGKTPTASISRIYDKERTRSTSKKPLQGGRGG